MEHKLAIVGSAGGGTSCVASVLEGLGYCLGGGFPNHPQHGFCTYEDGPLTEVVSHCLFAEHKPQSPETIIVECMRQYYRRMRLASRLVAYKYPNLGAHPDLLREALGDDGNVLVVYRDWSCLSASALSRPEDRWGPLGDAARCYSNLEWGRFHTHWPICVSYDFLMAQPGCAVRMLAATLGLCPTDLQLSEAASRINTHLQHHKGGDEHIPASLRTYCKPVDAGSRPAQQAAS
jgi:hypothetical protein